MFGLCVCDFFQIGGYDLMALANSAAVHVSTLHEMAMNNYAEAQALGVDTFRDCIDVKNEEDEVVLVKEELEKVNEDLVQEQTHEKGQDDARIEEESITSVRVDDNQSIPSNSNDISELLDNFPTLKVTGR